MALLLSKVHKTDFKIPAPVVILALLSGITPGWTGGTLCDDRFELRPVIANPQDFSLD